MPHAAADLISDNLLPRIDRYWSVDHTPPPKLTRTSTNRIVLLNVVFGISHYDKNRTHSRTHLNPRTTSRSSNSRTHIPLVNAVQMSSSVSTRRGCGSTSQISSTGPDNDRDPAWPRFRDGHGDGGVHHNHNHKRNLTPISTVLVVVAIKGYKCWQSITRYSKLSYIYVPWSFIVSSLLVSFLSFRSRSHAHLCASVFELSSLSSITQFQFLLFSFFFPRNDVQDSSSMRKRHGKRIQSVDQGDLGECWEQRVQSVWRILYLNIKLGQ